MATASFLRKDLTYRDLEVGVSASAAKDALQLGLTRDDIRMIIPDRTLNRRIAEGANLTIDEADGLARLARVFAHALRAFGDKRLANLWLRNPNPALGDRVPMQMAHTDLGAREVDVILGRIEHGIFS